MTGNATHLKGTAHPKDFPSKQIEYRSFIKTIPLYHYDHSHHSIQEFEKSVSEGDTGFIYRLESTDPFINEDGSEKMPVPDGDEVPAGFTEVAYLRSVFRDPTTENAKAQGSALGFRLLDEDRIEWFCFRNAVDDTLKVQTDHGPLFQLVGHIDRGDPNINYKGKVGGYQEHRLWYESLQDAKEPVLTLEAIETNRRRPLRGLRFNEDGLGVEPPEKDDQPTDSEEPDSAPDVDMKDADDGNQQEAIDEPEESEESEEE